MTVRSEGRPGSPEPLLHRLAPEEESRSTARGAKEARGWRRSPDFLFELEQNSRRDCTKTSYSTIEASHGGVLNGRTPRLGAILEPILAEEGAPRLRGHGGPAGHVRQQLPGQRPTKTSNAAAEATPGLVPHSRCPWQPPAPVQIHPTGCVPGPDI